MATETSTYTFEGHYVDKKIELFVQLVNKLPAVKTARRRGSSNSVVVHLNPHECILTHGSEIARLRSIANRYKPKPGKA